MEEGEGGWRKVRVGEGQRGVDGWRGQDECV